ncbi:ExbD/TolR family protein [Noviherbaspirillum sp. Root189]|uniref:ExbD/TolR family protein n=1 Tax=Noviherbaspirillum sp. Root189 TaxID=1736487 RepID=UPI00070C747D|nr:biopolymer transporter ExbD [Noviherbaspirillum sp. Root189]KRB93303.1 biopolymer transporter ExbD [Noviherbaspirillum sp. Root189]
MSFGNPDNDDDVMSEINMTPLVDVMLVLLIIFIITIPVINHAVKLDLPRAASQPNDVKPPHIDVSIDANGVVTWNGNPVDPQALKENIAVVSAQSPQPELHLRADRKTPYENVAQLMSAAQTGGLNKIGFVTEPDASR